MGINLKGNTNYACFTDLNNNKLAARTNLSAIDMNVGNGLAVSGDTLYIKKATSADVTNGTANKIIDAARLNSSLPIVSAGTGTTVSSSGRTYTVGLKDYESIITLTGNTVTVAPGNGYRLDATAGSKTIAIGTFDTGMWGRESHIELFVTSAGYVHTGTNVTLIDPLEPDAVNNCTVRFHDGHAVISVEDHTETYMVNTTGTGSATSGTLAYGLKQTGLTNQFIGFRNELNTSSVPTGGATATVAKHIVGNGMDVGPTITGNLIISGGATVRNIKVGGATVTSGSATFENVTLTSDAVVSMGTAGGVIVGAGTLLDMTGNTNAEPITGAAGGLFFQPGGVTIYPSAGSASAVFVNFAQNVNKNTVLSAITSDGHIRIKNSGTILYGDLTGSNLVFENGGFELYASPTFSNVTFLSGNQISGNIKTGTQNGFCALESCVFSNTSGAPGVLNVYYRNGCSGSIKDCVLDGQVRCSGTLTFAGNNKLHAVFGNATMTISSGTTITLGNSMGGSSITVEPGGCVVNGATIAAGTYKKITSVGGSASATV